MEHPSWLLLTYKVPPEPAAKRVSLWRKLKGLGAEERAAIERWTAALARRFAHIPCLGLKGLLYDGPEGSIEAFLNGLDGECADELRGALEQGSRASAVRPEAHLAPLAAAEGKR